MRWVCPSLRVEFTQAYALSLHKPARFLHVIENDNKNSTFTHSDNFTNGNTVSIIQNCTYLQSSTAISFLTWCEQNVAASEAANFAIAASCKWQCALNLLQSCYNTIERTDQIYFNWHSFMRLQYYFLNKFYVLMCVCVDVHSYTTHARIETSNPVKHGLSSKTILIYFCKRLLSVFQHGRFPGQESRGFQSNLHVSQLHLRKQPCKFMVHVVSRYM